MVPDGAATGRFFDVEGKTLHYTMLGEGHEGRPIVFLHEGLGSVELWRSFPSDVVERVGRPGLAYSRQGNGWSSPLEERRLPDYMHHEALEVLPRVLDRLVGGPTILVGHSDGASIALVYAGAGHPVEQLVLIAPHVFVEDETIESIAAIRTAFEGSDMAEKMSRYHTEPRTTFYGWADIWLSPEFRDWNIEDYLTGVTCPTLLVQGSADQYGTDRQLDVIEARVTAPTERVSIETAGHSPHLSHPDLVTSAIAGFIDRHR